MRFPALLLLVLGLNRPLAAQLLQPKPAYSRADSLRGSLTAPLRTCYDITSYHLDVRLDVAQRSLSGSNLFRFAATRDFSRLQFDLFANMTVDKVVYQGKELPFKREFNAVFVIFPKPIRQGSRDEFTVCLPRPAHRGRARALGRGLRV